jgi:hypothetical protein
VGGTSLAAYVGMPLCELPGAYLASLSSWLLERTGGRRVRIEGPMDVEHCLYRGTGAWWLAVKNHSTEKRMTRFEVATGWKAARVRELTGAASRRGGGEPRAVEFSAGRVAFRDAPDANCVRIYEIARH